MGVNPDLHRLRPEIFNASKYNDWFKSANRSGMVEEYFNLREATFQIFSL
jgi:hypothetical protein